MVTFRLDTLDFALLWIFFSVVAVGLFRLGVWYGRTKKDPPRD